MKYLVFTFDDDEPGGGFFDFRGFGETVEKARKVAEENGGPFSSYQIVRKEDLAIVEERIRGVVDTEIKIPKFDKNGNYYG